jgi:hypothetical protein
VARLKRDEASASCELLAKALSPYSVLSQQQLHDYASSMKGDPEAQAAVSLLGSYSMSQIDGTDSDKLSCVQRVLLHDVYRPLVGRGEASSDVLAAWCKALVDELSGPFSEQEEPSPLLTVIFRSARGLGGLISVEGPVDYDSVCALEPGGPPGMMSDVAGLLSTSDWYRGHVETFLRCVPNMREHGATVVAMTKKLAKMQDIKDTQGLKQVGDALEKVVAYHGALVPGTTSRLAAEIQRLLSGAGVDGLDKPEEVEKLLSMATKQWPSNEELKQKMAKLSATAQLKDRRSRLNVLGDAWAQLVAGAGGDCEKALYDTAAQALAKCRGLTTQAGDGDDQELANTLISNCEKLVAKMDIEAAQDKWSGSKEMLELAKEVLGIISDDACKEVLVWKLSLQLLARQGLQNVSTYEGLAEDAKLRAEQCLGNHLVEISALIRCIQQMEDMKAEGGEKDAGQAVVKSLEKQRKCLKEAVVEVMEQEMQQLTKLLESYQPWARGMSDGAAWHDGSELGLTEALERARETVAKTSGQDYAAAAARLAAQGASWQEVCAKIGQDARCEALDQASACVASLRTSRAEGLLVAAISTFEAEASDSSARMKLKTSCMRVRRDLEKQVGDTGAWGRVQQDLRLRAEAAALLQ